MTKAEFVKQKMKSTSKRKLCEEVYEMVNNTVDDSALEELTELKKEVGKLEKENKKLKKEVGKMKKETKA